AALDRERDSSHGVHSPHEEPLSKRLAQAFDLDRRACHRRVSPARVPPQESRQTRATVRPGRRRREEASASDKDALARPRCADETPALCAALTSNALGAADAQ